ncbi:uncharacterized protein si:dkey-283b1.6 [Astyanax mexicanus]|uniref:uncharacterized protein si:dkey-283b1.6 n=1 Tax=Astyanax mexicanus TaxID=7994 RepID=UPI0020CB1D22|nr:uncharacterized protein si:dkey-283b1.6 [Astyanax mexicanus]
MLLNDPFPIIQIFVPLVAFAIVIICCTSLCKTLQRARREVMESQARTCTLETFERPSVYIIPTALPDDELHGPPRYSTVDHYSPPPSYDELGLKPDFIPHDPPPAYSESIHTPTTTLSVPAQLSISIPTQSHASETV